VYRRGDVGQVARALRILHALRGYPEGRKIAELAREVGVSERTVKRDLAELAAADIRIDRTPIDGRAAARLEDESHRSVAITRRERYTLLAIRRMFDVLKGTPLAEDVESVLAKLQQRATAKERAELAADRDRFAYVPDGGTKLYRGKEDILDALQTGVLLRRVIRFAYRGGRGRAQHGYLAPFSLILFKHGLYVIGRKLPDPMSGATIPRGRPELYAAERFTEAEYLRDHAFVVPPDFALDAVLFSAFELHVGDPADAKRVVVEFSKERAEYARARQWHPSQVIEEQGDGSVIVRFTCVNFAPVVSWVHEWGPHAKVLEPPELAETVTRELRETLHRYEGTDRADASISDGAASSTPGRNARSNDG
jgi:predicted DNA-binding transcriptional regulator YafY